MSLRPWRFAALSVAALSLGPSFAHVLEAPPRLTVWPPELWRDATVFHGQFALFASVGGVLDVAAVVLLALLAFVSREERPAFAWALAAAILNAAALSAWFAMVAPVNAVLATWKPGPIPADFEQVRRHWEAGHMVVAALKAAGFAAALGSGLSAPRPA